MVESDSEKKLLEAARYRSLGGVRFFVKRGVDVNCQDSSGMTPLHWASQKGGADVVEFLLENGANIAIEDSDGNAALHHAAMFGEVAITRMLIKAGSDIAKKNIFDKSPSDLAKEFRESDPG